MFNFSTIHRQTHTEKQKQAKRKKSIHFFSFPELNFQTARDER